MAHNLEIVNGVAQMAYTGQTPWHGLGHKVGPNCTPAEIQKAAGLNWKVAKKPLKTSWKGKNLVVPGKEALVRLSDGKVLDVVGEDWFPLQNKEVFDFYNEFVEAGQVTMETAGSLHDGEMIWALAKTKESFALCRGKDVVETYLLFYSPHKYGKTAGTKTTQTRVVCNNTFMQALRGGSDIQARIHHRTKFSPDEVKTQMGLAKKVAGEFKEAAKLLVSKLFNQTEIDQYFKDVFPATGEKLKENEASLAATTASALLTTQPGAELGEGTWWSAFNATTFAMDHVLGRSQDNRLQSAWFGSMEKRKTFALDRAVDYAKKSKAA